MATNTALEHQNPETEHFIKPRKTSSGPPKPKRSPERDKRGSTSIWKWSKLIKVKISLKYARPEDRRTWFVSRLNYLRCFHLGFAFQINNHVNHVILESYSNTNIRRVDSSRWSYKLNCFERLKNIKPRKKSSGPPKPKRGPERDKSGWEVHLELAICNCHLQWTSRPLRSQRDRERVDEEGGGGMGAQVVAFHNCWRGFLAFMNQALSPHFTAHVFAFQKYTPSWARTSNIRFRGPSL